MTATRTLALVTALTLVIAPATAAAADPAAPPSTPRHAFVQQGVRTAGHVGTPAPAPTSAPGVAPARPPARPQLAPEDPPPAPTKEECRGRADAETRPDHLTGWYKNRYSWCAWGTFIAPGRDAGNPAVVAEFSTTFTVIGYGNNGARQFDYIVYLDDIKTTGSGINWAAATVGASFTGCNASMTCPLTNRVATVGAWQAVNTAAFTFTSGDVAGAGLQLVSSTMTLNLDFATPTQPEWVWGAPGGVSVGSSPIRYDSAPYVGRARGAIFPDHRLVFAVDRRQANQDESALHILHALDRPQLTFPSWVGKSVPSKTEPLTRMYNSAANDSNRTKSEAMCRATFGTWDSTLQNCDEYPFASTYEGSRTGPDTYGWGERYSVRLIGRDDNQYVGGTLLEVNFYRALRVLDGDKFWVTVLQ